MSFILALKSNPFLQMAILAGILTSLASGVVGSFVVIKRIIFLAGSIAHSILCGLGLFLWISRTYNLPWLSPVYGAFLAALASGLLMGYIHLKHKQREDAVIATIWATGMAIGVIFISLTPGQTPELMSFLFGNILWVRSLDLWLLFGLDLAILAIMGRYYSQFLVLCFDEEQAHMQGLAVKRLYLLLLSLVAITVVLLIQIIGIILAIALLTIPATIAGLFTKKLSSMIVLAVVLCAVFNTLGIALSYELDWPSGATIAITASIFYFLSLGLKARKPSPLMVKKI